MNPAGAALTVSGMDIAPETDLAPHVLAPMSREAFRAWAEALERGHYERLDGRPVAKELERLIHNLVKMHAWLALREAAATAPVPCTAYGDGVTVEVGPDTDYEPDAVLNLGPPLPLDRYDAPNPVVIVEVTSPSTSRIDVTRKLRDYFTLPSVQHYLVVRAREQMVLHHRRSGEGWDVREITAGRIPLDPPGITIALADLFAGL